MNQNIFKAYDIRGIYPNDLNEGIVEKIGRAYVSLIKPKKILIGRDMRISSPALASSLINSVTKSGVNVLDLGMVSSDAFYFSCAQLNLPGIMVTASHNPKEYNGLKMVKEIPYFIGAGSGMEEIQELVDRNGLTKAKKAGTVEQIDLTDEFVKKVLSFCNPKKIRPLRVVIDPCNGMAGKYLDKIFSGLPIKVIKQHFEPDGNFPNHGGDPLIKENRQDLEARVLEEKADLGFSFDPDVDRFFVIDDLGQFVPGDFLTTLLGLNILKKYPGAKIILDVRASWSVRDMISQAGGIPLINRVGHAFIKRRMAEEGAVFAGEITGHYYFSDFYKVDSGLIPAMLVLQMVSESGKKLSQILKPLRQKYFISGEINTKLSSQKQVTALLNKISVQYRDGKITKIDGVSVEYPDWHFNVRASNTEPLIRLNLEAMNQKLMEEKKAEILKIIS